MYWLYLLLFVCILVFPGFIERGWISFFLDRGTTEIIFVSLASFFAFILFFIRDHQYRQRREELIKKQKEVNRLSKELSSSYSYIGEVNRKFEILQDVTLEIPELLEGGEENLYHDILRAIRIFSGCQNFVIVLCSKEGKEECAKFYLPDSKLSALPKEVDFNAMMRNPKQWASSNGQYSIMEAIGTIAGIHCLGVFQKSSIREDVRDLLRPLLMQILLLYAYSKKKEQF